ncbi:uncharacterized protein LOC142344271 isoform X2 [Convolutriloba macropyga]
MLQFKVSWFLLFAVCLMIFDQQTDAGGYCKHTKECPYYEKCNLHVLGGFCMPGCDDVHPCRFSQSGLHCHPERLKCTECTGKDKECGKGGTCYPDGHCEWH